ncbi:MAG: hypothetical protein ACK5L0_04775 [Candidatus Fimivivens sp.]
MASTSGMSTESWWVLTMVASLAIGAIIYFLKRTMSTVDNHGKDIQSIQLTYVTKDEMKTLKAETADELSEIQSTVGDIKDKYLTKDDFYRTQAKTEQKLDKMYDLLLSMSKGGNNHGQ